MTILEETAISTNIINLSTSAAEAVRGLLEKRALSAEDYALRVFVSGGGCSGFQYGMSLESNIREEDKVISAHGIKLVIDEISIDYLNGASIDYVEDVMGSGFKIENPNAVSSCGCGSSFKTKDDNGSPSNGGGCSC